MNRAERFARTSVAIACAYETVAITSRRCPTISTLCRRHRAIEALILVGLTAHLTF